MLHLFLGTDRAKARAAMMANAEKGKNTTVVRVTDANAIADLSTALAGKGMFDTGARSIVLEGTMQNQDMRQVVIAALPAIKDSDEHYYIYEEKPDAATRRTLEKYAETTEKFDALKQREDTAIFALKGALQQGDKKKAVDWDRARIDRRQVRGGSSWISFLGCKRHGASRCSRAREEIRCTPRGTSARSEKARGRA
jgi:hypothetical protein